MISQYCNNQIVVRNVKPSSIPFEACADEVFLSELLLSLPEPLTPPVAKFLSEFAISSTIGSLLPSEAAELLFPPCVDPWASDMLPPALCGDGPPEVPDAF